MNALQLSAAQTAARTTWREFNHRGGKGRPVFADDALRALLATGISQAEAARRLGVTPVAVCKRLKTMGLR